MPLPSDLLDASLTQPFTAEIIDLYRSCYAAPPWCETPEQLDAYPAKLAASLTRPGFTAVTAHDATGRLTGICYGWPTPAELPHHHIYRCLLQAFPTETISAFISGAFEVAELFVHPDAQHMGIGRRLLTHATSGRPTSWLLTSPAAPAAALYRRLGWHEAGPLPRDLYPQLELSLFTRTA